MTIAINSHVLKMQRDCRINYQEMKSRQLQLLITRDIYIGVISNHETSTARNICDSVIFLPVICEHKRDQFKHIAGKYASYRL